MLGKQIVRREALYSDFISESARLLADAMHNANDLQKLLPIYALISRIRLSSSQSVLHKAEQVINIIVSTYPQPNLTTEEIESRAINGEDPLKQFSDTCRAELMPEGLLYDYAGPTITIRLLSDVPQPSRIAPAE